MVHIISSHESYIAEYKYIGDMCQQDRPKGITTVPQVPTSFTAPYATASTTHKDYVNFRPLKAGMGPPAETQTPDATVTPLTEPKPNITNKNGPGTKMTPIEI